ncbi:MAG: hypothetical protein RL297_372 [Pseudomonadota bacterium]
MSLATTGFELVTKRTRKREFLDEMDLVIPWRELVGLITPHAPTGKTGTVVDATLIAAPSSTMNNTGERPQRQTPTTSHKRMPCCTDKKKLSLPMRATGGLKSAMKSRSNTPMWTGKSP